MTLQEYLRFLQEELPQLLEDVRLTKRGRMYFQHDGSVPLSFSREVTSLFIDHFPG